MSQSYQVVFFNKPGGGILPIHPVSPTLGQKGIDALCNPPVQSIEQLAHMCLAIEVTPTAYYRIDLLDQSLGRNRSLPPRELADLILELSH